MRPYEWGWGKEKHRDRYDDTETGVGKQEQMNGDEESTVRPSKWDVWGVVWETVVLRGREVWEMGSGWMVDVTWGGGSWMRGGQRKVAPVIWSGGRGRKVLLVVHLNCFLHLALRFWNHTWNGFSKNQTSTLIITGVTRGQEYWPEPSLQLSWFCERRFPSWIHQDNDYERKGTPVHSTVAGWMLSGSDATVHFSKRLRVLISPAKLVFSHSCYITLKLSLPQTSGGNVWRRKKQEEEFNPNDYDEQDGHQIQVSCKKDLCLTCRRRAKEDDVVIRDVPFKMLAIISSDWLTWDLCRNSSLLTFGFVILMLNTWITFLESLNDVHWTLESSSFIWEGCEFI